MPAVMADIERFVTIGGSGQFLLLWTGVGVVVASRLQDVVMDFLTGFLPHGHPAEKDGSAEENVSFHTVVLMIDVQI